MPKAKRKTKKPAVKVEDLSARKKNPKGGFSKVSLEYKPTTSARNAKI